MKHLLGASLMVAIIATLGCDAAQDEKPAPPNADGNEPAPSNPGGNKPAPLKLDNDAPPLLLDDAEPLLLLGNSGPPVLEGGVGDPGELPAAKGPVADNTRCFVCHMNYSQERLAVGHARADVGCEKCHGACDEHCGDENNITPPTIMFPKDQVDPACKVCHDPAKVIEGHIWCMREVKPSDAGKYCTECHGKHVVPVRTVRWDKKTGKLLEKIEKKAEGE